MSQITEQFHSSEIEDILDNSLNGKRPDKNDCLETVIESDDVQLMGILQDT